MTNKCDPKFIRQKALDKMNSAEKDFFRLEVEEAAAKLAQRYKNEPNLLIAVAKALRDEAGRQLYHSGQLPETPQRSEPDLQPKPRVPSIFDPESF